MSSPVESNLTALPSGDSTVLDISGLRLGVSCDRPLADIAFDPAYGRFVCTGTPHSSIRCTYVDGPLSFPSDAVQIFDSQGLWTLHDSGDSLLFIVEAPEDGVGPYRIASFNPEFTHGEIVSRTCGRTGVCGPLMPDPLEYPLGEAIMVAILARGHGIMVHACGLSLDGRGVLLLGHSGAGKSTIARLVGDEAVVMNDDRIIVSMEGSMPRIYGTPWHGDHPGVDPRGVELTAIVFIEHASEGRIDPVGGAAIAADLVSKSFPTIWDPSGLDHSLGIVCDLITTTPCFRMGFVPDRSVLNLIRCAV